MTDLICRKTMQRCQYPGMCSPHGGCQPDKGFEVGYLDLGQFVDWVWNLKAERDQLKAENEAMRKLKLPHYLKLSDEMRAAGDHAELRAREDQCYSVPVLKAVFFEAAIQRWLDDQEEAIDAALAKEASR